MDLHRGAARGAGRAERRRPHRQPGPLSTAVRHFTVFCDSIYHFVGIVDVVGPRPDVQPVLAAHPALQRAAARAAGRLPQSGGRPVGRADHPLPGVAGDPAVGVAGAARRTPASWRGWTMYLLTQPLALDFLVRFTPDPAQPSPAFNGVVACVAAAPRPPPTRSRCPRCRCCPSRPRPG